MIEFPPSQYDHPFNGRIEIHSHYGGEISAWNGPCFPYLGTWACAKLFDGVCHIYIQHDKLSPELLRHEIAHCNGWRH